MKKTSTTHYLRATFSLVFVLLSAVVLGQRSFKLPAHIHEKTHCLPQTVMVKIAKPVQILSNNPQDYIQATIRQAAKITQIKQAYTRQDFAFTKPISPQQRQIAETTLQETLSWYEVKIAPDMSIEKAINLLLQDNNVEFAEPKYIHFPLYVPNDPLANPVGSAPQYHLEKVGMYQAWDIEKGNSNVVVGITDNGMDLTHPDGGNFVQGTRDDVADGDNNVLGGSHGVVVTLVSNAKVDNNTMGAGIAFDCKYLAVKVAPNSNLNTYTVGYEGILYAAKFPNCKVVNASWGRTGSPSNLEMDFLRSVVAVYDVVVVAAAGNDNNSNYYYPAAYDLVLAVAGTNSNDIKSSNSSFYDKVGICAPGQGINTEFASQNSLGTSFAAPIVSGAAALVRAKYPQLTANQVIQRLKATADPSLYNLPGNSAFIGKLGSGRLDVLKALQEPSFAIDSVFFANSTHKGYIYNNETRPMVVRFSNLGNILPNLQISVVENSPFVTISKSVSNLTNVPVGTTVSNQIDAFVVSLTSDAPANLIVKFTFTFTYGSQNYTYAVDVLLNPAQVDVNSLKFTLADNGTLAHRNPAFYDLTGLSTVNNVSGINTRVCMLQEAGFLVGKNNTQVSDAVRNLLPNRDNDFTTSVPFRQHVSPSQDYSYSNTVFTDIPNNPNRLNVQITQRSYAWNTPQRKDFVIIEYRVKNIGTSSLVNLFAGLYADWNVITPNNNRARWNNALKLGYVHDVNNLYYTGIALLTDNFQNYTAYNNAANPLADGFSTAEKFLALSSTPQDTTAGLTFSGQDVSHLLSAKLPLLEVGQEAYVAFAFVVGETFSEIYQTTLQAQQTYKEIQTSPVPILNNVEVCKGSTYTIVPQGGSRFTFYVQPPPAVPIFTGNSLLVNNIRSPRTYYVTCVDSLFESPAATITISPIEHTTQFSISPNDSIDLRVAGATPITFQSTTQGAVQWQWNFGNGQTANVSNPPPVLYENEGIYPVKLVTRNAQNCTDSLTQNIVIYRSPITQLASWQAGVSFAPNPFEEWIHLYTKENLGQATLEVWDVLGRKLYQVSFSFDQVHTLQLHDLPKGTLLFRLQTTRGTLLQKVVKR